MKKDLDLLQDPNLAKSLAVENLSIDVSVDEDKEGAQKYEFPYRANFMHNIPSEEKEGYISPPVSTHPIISDNVSIASSTPDLCEHTPKDYIFEEN